MSIAVKKKKKKVLLKETQAAGGKGGLQGKGLSEAVERRPGLES